jgi:hypothetical protein
LRIVVRLGTLDAAAADVGAVVASACILEVKPS